MKKGLGLLSGVKVACGMLAQKHVQSFLFHKFDIVQQTIQTEWQKKTISGDCFSLGLFALRFSECIEICFCFVTFELAHNRCLAEKMESKKKLPYDPQEVPEAKRFRANVSDAFLNGDVSGQRTHFLFADAMDAGAASVSDLAGNHQPGLNSARDLLRKKLKGHQWPTLYRASIPCWSEKEQKEQKEVLPFLFLTKSCTSSNILIFLICEIWNLCLQRTWLSSKKEQTC